MEDDDEEEVHLFWLVLQTSKVPTSTTRHPKIRPKQGLIKPCFGLDCSEVQASFNYKWGFPKISGAC